MYFKKKKNKVEKIYLVSVSFGDIKEKPLALYVCLCMCVRPIHTHTLFFVAIFRKTDIEFLSLQDGQILSKDFLFRGRGCGFLSYNN